MLVFASSAPAVDKIDTEKLRTAVTVDGMMEHERALQRIADANGGNRAAGTSGQDATVAYVADRLRDAGYRVSLEAFDFPTWTENSPAVLTRTAPAPEVTFAPGTDFITAQMSGAGDITKAVVPTSDVAIAPGSAANTSTSGCEASDFPAATSGNIALVQRGTCTFVVKIANAKAAGAAGVIVFNEGNDASRSGAIGIAAPPYIGIPVVGASTATGQALLGGATARLKVDATTTPRTQYNVTADTTKGDPSRTIVVGAHMDSVVAGPGINDNGSGTSALIETAEQMAKLGTPVRNRVRFAFWGAEEAGLIGSTAYVSQRSSEELADIALNLNFDMLASPNFVRFVYDGNTDQTPPPAGGAPAGSGTIEQVFLRYFASQDLATAPTAFDGRSDYGPFIAKGIPAGGLFSGAEGIKTAAQAETFGGTAGAPYDPCYHQACDKLNPMLEPGNLNLTALDQMSDAVAHSVWTFARSKSTLFSTYKGKGKAKGRAQNLPFQGPFARR